VVGVLGIPPAVEVELYRIGIELRSIVELDAFAQLEGVGKPPFSGFGISVARAGATSKDPGSKRSNESKI